MLGLGKDELGSFCRRGIGGICDGEFWDLVGILERVSLFEEEEDCTEHFQNTTGCGIRVKLAILDFSNSSPGLGRVKGQVCSEIGVNDNDNHSNTRSGFGLRKGHCCNEYALHFVQFAYSCTTVCIFSHNKVCIDAHLCAFWQCAAHEIKFMAWCAWL